MIINGSGSLTKSQANYAIVELEALAILYKCKMCNLHLRNLKEFEVKTTYRPFQGVFQRQMHDMDNARLFRIREKLANYSFKMTWTHGKQNKIADSLCRAPMFKAEEARTYRTMPCKYHNTRHISPTQMPRI